MVGRGVRAGLCPPARGMLPATADFVFTTGWQVGYLALGSRGDSLISIEELRKWDIVVVIRL